MSTTPVWAAFFLGGCPGHVQNAVPPPLDPFWSRNMVGGLLQVLSMARLRFRTESREATVTTFADLQTCQTECGFVGGHCVWLVLRSWKLFVVLLLTMDVLVADKLIL